MLYSPTKIQEVCASIVIGKESMSHMSRRLGLDIKEVVVWCALFRTYGAEVFTSPQDFDISLRERIVEDHLKNGLSLTHTFLLSAFISSEVQKQVSCSCRAWCAQWLCHQSDAQGS